MSQGSIKAQFGRYVSLNILGMVGISCYILADTYFIAVGVGVQGLAALNFALVLYMVMQAIGLMIGIGGATQFQIRKAQGKVREACGTFMNALYMAAAAAAVLGVAGIGFASPLSFLLGADSETTGGTVVYLTTIFSFAPFFLANNILLPFVRNDGSPQLAMASMLGGSLMNIALDYLFVLVLDWGMFGAAFATGLAPIIGMAILSLHFIRRRASFRPIKAAPDFRSIRHISALGFSSFVVEISAGLVLFVFNWVILSFEGTRGVAAYGIVANLAFVGNALFVGLAQGIQPLASRCYGLGQKRELTKVLRYSLATALGIAVVLLLVVLFGAEPLADAFNRDRDPHLTELASWGMRIYFTGFLFAGINIVSAAFFSSVEQPGRGMAITLIRGFAAIAVFIFVLSSLWGMLGVWMTFPVAEATTACLTAFFLVQFARKLEAGHG